MPPIPFSAEFDSEPFQLSDGALVLFKDDGRAEPYFATKALLAAHEFNLDIGAAASGWINWMLPRQQQAGNFRRYQLNDSPPPVWVDYVNLPPMPDGKVDADDSLLSTWVELLYTLAPKPPAGQKGLPQTWKNSASAAYTYLKKTFRTSGQTSGLCQAFAMPEDSEAYLMDNCEVYQALTNIAAGQRRVGLGDDALETEARATKLGSAIISVMWKSAEQRFWCSEDSELPSERLFYPHHFAQVFPILHDLATPGLDYNSFFADWLTLHEATWLNAYDNDAPTNQKRLTANGQVAHAAFKLGRLDIAQKWMDVNISEGRRYKNQWTIWDEAIYQGLQFNLS